MGCTESVPVAGSFDTAHKMKTPPIAKFVVSDQKQEIIVREKLFSWSGDSFKIKTRQGKAFGGGMKIKGKAIAFRDQMALLDNAGNPIAICLRKFEFFAQTFKIYTLRQIHPNQPKSNRDYNGQPLYTYAKVERAPLTTIQQVTFEGETTPSMTISRAGGLWPKKRLVKYRNRPAAYMEGGTWEGNWNSYLLTVSPGIDPCLIVCLTAICDKMDEEQ